jgi:hypothetical protein
MRRAALVACALLLFVSTAHAKVLAEAPMQGGAIVLLHDEAGPCVGGAQLAQYVTAAGEITPGCWVVRPSGTVAIVFLDGDVSALSPAILRTPKSI